MLKWLVLLWVFFLPVQFQTKGFVIPRFAPSDVLVLAYIPYFLSTGGWRIARRFWHNSLTGLAFVFLLGNFVFFFTTGEISRYAITNKTLGLLFVMLSYSMVGSYASAGWDRIHQLTRLFTRAVTLHSLIAILIMAFGLSRRLHLNYAGGGRLAGFLIDPNAFGGLLACAFVIALAFYFRKGALYRPVEGAISASILALGAFLTYSRSSWIGLVAGTALGLLVGKVRNRLMSVVVIFLLGVAVYYTAPAVLETEVSMPAGEYSQFMAMRNRPVEGRLVLIGEGMRMFWESPLWGKGLGYFQWERGSRTVVHNTAVWMLVEMGLIGAAAFVWFILGHFLRAWYSIKNGRERSLPTNIGLLCGFVALAGLSAGIEALNQRHWWLIMALISSAYYLTKIENIRPAVRPNGTPRRPAV